MARLKRVDCSQPGISRRRRGRGFEYLEADGTRVTAEDVLARIRELAIPPAWTDVWICTHPNGHLQATGSTAPAGSSTSTTRIGARAVTGRSSRRCSTSRARYRDCEE